MKRKEDGRTKEIDYYRYDVVEGDYPAMGNPGELRYWAPYRYAR
jgi:hypothetical protein